MKKYQYMVALSCVVVGALSLGGFYAFKQIQEKQNQTQERNIEIGSITEEQTEEVKKQEQQVAINDMPELESEFATEKVIEIELEPTNTETEVADLEMEKKEDTTVSKITEEVLHFQPEKGVVWPIKGSVLLDYSMDSTIFFPTLQQYQYNPAMILSGNVNDKVYFVAKGKITDIFTNEVTGCTVVQDIGDGYTAIYGQLKELNFEVGDLVQSGQVVGYVSEPTKYFSVEGSNVYFQLLKNGMPVDPEEVLNQARE